jgi:hypothetical protein
VPVTRAAKRFFTPRARVALALVAVASLLAATAWAAFPRFGANDVRTLFFISKSDDKNRVDYGIRLDAECRATGSDAVFAYWREFEPPPPVRTHALSFMDRLAYGISAQGPIKSSGKGGEHYLRLKRYPRDIRISTQKGSGGCEAVVRTTIAGVPSARLASIFAKLSGPLSVAYIDIAGTHPKTGALLQERLKP